MIQSFYQRRLLGYAAPICRVRIGLNEWCTKADCFHKTLAANKDNASAATNPEIITIPSITSRASSLGSRSPGVEITKMAHRHDVRPTSMCDEMAMYAAVQLAGMFSLDFGAVRKALKPHKSYRRGKTSSGNRMWRLLSL